ncbi:hypothetical protein DY000_02039393 [Brassica cretica]|uniref:CCHC-type domain-containing protein n=1 Tax=Brassica cretica TaxID=69181 RepID=A0ABQ7B907_BRACR|nr:hypothetical protein DY000_02039393 [Brassica cretica]
MAEVTETVDQMRRNRWLPGRSDYYMCGEPGYMVRDCLEDTEAVEEVVATVDGQEEVVATVDHKAKMSKLKNVNCSKCKMRLLEPQALEP